MRRLFARLFGDHPRSLDETYLEHGRTAMSYAFPLLLAGCACLVHAAIPGLFTCTASQTLRRLHARLGQRDAASVRLDGVRLQ